MISNKTRFILLSIIGSLIIVLSISYAYFMLDIQTEAKTSVKVSSSTLDELKFTEGDPIHLEVHQFNLPVGGGNLSSTTSSQVTLIANDNTNTATKDYDVYFDIVENEYIYTTQSKKPEILLTITDHNNQPITNIVGFNYVTIDGISGFDITEYRGKIPVKRKQEITTNSSTTGTTHIWTATVSFINLDTLQHQNQNKDLEANLVMEAYQLPRFYETILSDKGGASYIEGRSTPNFNAVATTNEGMFPTEDDYGTSYYFRGAVNNNWVKFGKDGTKDIWWRIVKINGDYSVKLIYSGTTAPTSGQAVIMEGTGTQIGTSAYHSLINKAEYVGYTYEVGKHRGYTSESIIKVSIDSWYNSKLKPYEEYLQDVIMCNDKTSFLSTNGVTPVAAMGLPSSGTWYYGTYVRLNTQKNPTLKCPNKEDAYTKSDSVKGNAKLANPVGLLTADEVMMAGGKFNTGNNNYYLNTNQNYWLSAPYQTTTSTSYALYVFTGGHVYSNSIQDSYGIRPVISLKPDLMVTGNGLYNNPYVPIID